jgi:two-component system, OmpR family, response regulator
MQDLKHILFVDDDLEIRTLVGEYLERNGYRVSLAADGAQMQSILAKRPIQLVILDLMLPGVDGLTLCRNLRTVSDLPIMILTAKGDPIDRILGLEIGADDYLTKPFEPRELLARIRNLFKRSTSQKTPSESDLIYRFAGWKLETQLHQLTSPEGVDVALSTSEYRLLLVFLTHANRVLSRDKLMDLLKGREPEAFDRSVDLRVSRLRQKLNDDARSPRIIRTLRSEGYMFIAPIESHELR